MSHLIKIAANCASRILFYLKTLYLRLFRIINHFATLIKLVIQPDKQLIHYSYSLNKFLVWLLELGFLLGDIFAIPEILEIIHSVIYPKIRQLTAEEKRIIKEVYHNKIDLTLINIDNYGKYFIDRASAFVGFNTIFFNTKVKSELLIHEICHCWQYQKYGSVYIIRALMAQNSYEGYDYGGIKNLKEIIKSGNLNQLNYEQMAEVFAHYYTLKNPDNFNLYEDQEEIITVYKNVIEKLLK